MTDPLHTALRWRGNLTPRHPYSVAGPNSLWHIGKYCRFAHSMIYMVLQIFCRWSPQTN